MGKVKIVIPQVTYDVDEALIEGLRCLGALRGLDMSTVDPEFHAPFGKLFDYAKERMKEGGRDRHLPDLVRRAIPSEPNAPEWTTDTDARHTVASFGYLAEICNSEPFDRGEQKVLLTAMIVHDCAYPKAEGFAAFTSSDTRLVHMRDAEEEFRCFAVRVNRDFPCFYTLDDIEQVCSIVRQHDNPGVKKHGEPLQFSYDPPARRLIWSHREADRLWMLDKAGFALDLLRRLLEPNPWYDPPQYLNHVISSHLKEAETYHDNGSCIDFGGRKSMYRSNAGFGIFRRLVGERAAEFGVAV